MLNWKVFKTEKEYQKAIHRTLDIFDAQEGTAEADELALLLVLVKDYEEKHVVLPVLDPLEIVKLKMEEQGMKVEDLEPIIGTGENAYSLLSGRDEISLKTAQKLKNYFQLPAEIFLPTV